MLNQTHYDQHKQNNPLDLQAAELREKAFKKFQAEGLPSKKEEAWKYTSLSEVGNYDWLIASEEKFLSHDQMLFISKHLPSEFHNLVFVNGFLNSTLSDSDVNCEVVDLSKADFVVPDGLADEKLYNMARAFGGQKIKINITKTTQLNKPIQVVQVVFGLKPIAVQGLLEVNIAQGCELKIINHYLGLSDQKTMTHMFNVDVKVNLQKDAHLKMVNLQNTNMHDYCFNRLSVVTEGFSHITILDVALGAKVSRHYLSTEFNGESAEAGLYGLSLLSQNQHCDQYTFIHHKIGHNQSVQHYKSILAEEARSVFRGRVRIEKNAQKANSEQLNNNLLISSKACVDSIPQLEIFADDVKAGHGSTVGQLNKEEIFYFLSRGISEKKSYQMLTHGFAKELVYKIDNEEIENYVFGLIEQKLKEIF